MRQLFGFMKKEYMGLVRSNRLIIGLVLFAAFGIMNPAMAKMTPWLLEQYSDSFAEVGLISTGGVEVDAITSWMQYYKNIPMAMLVFILMIGTALVSEYEQQTLIPILTKGVPRWKVVAAKLILILAFWSVGYWLCYGITYAYNSYYWDNSVAEHLLFPALCMYLLGIWLVSLVFFASGFLGSNSAVLGAAAGIFLLSYLLGMFPKLSEYLPTRLLQASELVTGGDVTDYYAAVISALLLSVIGIAGCIVCLNRRKI